MDYAPDGELGTLTVDELAQAAEWDGDASTFASTLRECGWIDEDGSLHDWVDYGGAAVEKRKLDAKRKRKQRKVTSTDLAKPQDVTSEGCPTDIRVTAQVEENRIEESRREREDAHATDASQGREGEESANIPTADEVVAKAALLAIPESYARHYHEISEIRRRWITPQGRLIDWGRELPRWWARDRATWKEGPNDGRPVEEIEAELRSIPETPQNYARRDALIEELRRARKRKP